MRPTPGGALFGARFRRTIQRPLTTPPRRDVVARMWHIRPIRATTCPLLRISLSARDNVTGIVVYHPRGPRVSATTWAGGRSWRPSKSHPPSGRRGCPRRSSGWTRGCSARPPGRLRGGGGDRLGAVEDGVDRGEANDVRLGAAGRSAEQAFLAARQRAGDLDPALSRFGVECNSRGSVANRKSVRVAFRTWSSASPVSRPPNGSSWLRWTATTGKRLKKPLASSVPVTNRSSSPLVMWPVIGTCTSRADRCVARDRLQRLAAPGIAHDW